ncbi:MAG TPA: T9SS type A sorting domain-containing protein [Flavobacterium sp.]|nr:T9SS type A sorting domain-containing protein [Flavobacterium sp.]
MKHNYLRLFSAIFLLAVAENSHSQEYIPLLDNTSWTLTIANFGGGQDVSVSNPVDVTQGGFTYKKYNDPTVFGGAEVMVREDVAVRKVYRRVNNTDQLLYDFSMNQGEHIVLGDGNDYVVLSKDSVTVSTGRKRVRLYLLHMIGDFALNSETWIESVGSSQHPLKPSYEMPQDPYIYTICSYSGGLPVYNHGLANGQPTPTVCNFLALKEWDPKAIHVFPNPALDYVTVRFSDFQTNASVIVRNTLGQIVSTETNIQAFEKTISLNGPSGIYFVEITTDRKQNQAFKIIRK